MVGTGKFILGSIADRPRAPFTRVQFLCGYFSSPESAQIESNQKRNKLVFRGNVHDRAPP
jgi:hypothetical protein